MSQFNIIELGQVKGKRPSSETPPSSCHELSVMGHQLDGLYAIKDKATKKVQAVYCRFDSSGDFFSSFKLNQNAKKN